MIDTSLQDALGRGSVFICRGTSPCLLQRSAVWAQWRDQERKGNVPSLQRVSWLDRRTSEAFIWKLSFLCSDSSSSNGERKPALIATTSATSKIMHPPEDISLVSGLSDPSLNAVIKCFSLSQEERRAKFPKYNRQKSQPAASPAVVATSSPMPMGAPIVAPGLPPAAAAVSAANMMAAAAAQQQQQHQVAMLQQQQQQQALMAAALRPPMPVVAPPQLFVPGAPPPGFPPQAPPPHFLPPGMRPPPNFAGKNSFRHTLSFLSQC